MITSVITEGDSLTYTVNSYFYGYFGGPPTNVPSPSPRDSVRVFATDIIGANYSVSGSRLGNPSDPTSSGLLTSATRTNRLAALISPTRPGPVVISGANQSLQPRKYILSVMVGTNPGTPSSSDTTNPTTFGQTTAADFATYLTARVAAGFDGLVICTIPDRGDGIMANFNTYRQALNAVVRTWTSTTFGKPLAIADFGDTATTLGATAAYNNATYFNADKIHITVAGYALIQGAYNAAVNAVIADL